jgi:hypothetical protein
LKLGQPGEKLFIYFIQVSHQSEMNSAGMNDRILEILTDIHYGLRNAPVFEAFAFFAAVHRFWARLSTSSDIEIENPVKEIGIRVSELFEWVVALGSDSILSHFRIWIPSPTYRFLLNPIGEMRQLFVLPIGEFVWTQLIKALDAELTNDFMDLSKLNNMDELIKLRDPLFEVRREMKLALPLFSQTLGFIIDYERIILESIPFEDVARDLPMDFVVAVVFASKKKGLIPLEVSDYRILMAADYQHVDVTDLDHKRITAEKPPTIPIAMWDF